MIGPSALPVLRTALLVGLVLWLAAGLVGGSVSEPTVISRAARQDSPGLPPVSEAQGRPDLSAMDATRSAPLFVKTRTSPGRAAPEIRSEAPPALEVASGPLPTLQGTVLVGTSSMALLALNATRKWVRQGGTFEGWRVSRVEPLRVTVEANGLSRPIPLSRLNAKER